MNRKQKPRAEIILFLACVAIAIAPLALRGTSCGQDFDFHLESWMEAARQWHQGILYPHWIASANYGAGEPRFVFYPPLSWMLGALLGTLFPWTWAFIAFVLVALLAMGAAFYKMACEWMPADHAAIAACLYILNPYIFFVIYERAACAELLAAAWFPLLILYALRKKPAVPQLALIVAALWLTNAPAAVMGSYSLAIIVAVAAISGRRWKLIARAASGMALGLGLAAVYLIPAIYQQRWVEIDRAIGVGLRIQDSFLFERTGMAYHDQVLHTASWIAVLLLAATAIAAALSYRARKSQPLRAPLVALAAVIAFLLFPIGKIVWNIAPELRFLQFPWRWLLVLGLVFATFAGAALSDLGVAAPNSSHALRKPAPIRRNNALRAAIVLALALILGAHAWKHFWQPCDDEDNVRAQIATLHQEGFEGTDEYTAKAADNGGIQQDLPLIRVASSADADQANDSIEENPEYQPDNEGLLPAKIRIQRWQVEHMSATIQSPQPGYAILRLMDYPAWRVRINGKPIPRPTRGPPKSALPWREARGPGRPVREHRDDGLLTVPIPAGTSTIDVRYAATPDAWAGRSVSLVSLALWLVLWLAPAAKICRHRV